MRPTSDFSPPTKPVTVCYVCQNRIDAGGTVKLVDMGILRVPGPESEYRCAANRLNFVSNGSSSFRLCSEINTDGNCPDFVRITPRPQPEKKKRRWWPW